MGCFYKLGVGKLPSSGSIPTNGEKKQIYKLFLNIIQQVLSAALLSVIWYNVVQMS